MYEQYWGLQESPFQNTYDDRWLFENPIHDEALARLYYLVEQIRGCGMLIGPSGCGKTLVLNILARQAARTQRRVALVDLFGLCDEELLWQLASSLQLGPDPRDRRIIMWRKLQDHFDGLQMAQIQSLLIFDHLDQAEPGCLHAIERLMHMSQATNVWDSGSRSWVTVIAGVERAENVPSRYLRDHLTELRIELEPLDAELTAAFVETLVTKAGGSREIFSHSALQMLHRLTGGNPHLIRTVCHLSLIAAMGEELSTVNESVIKSVVEELRPEPRIKVA